MSRLNWANVAAPDFSTSLDGIRTAGSLLDQAFNRASSTIEGVDGDISARVNKAVLAKIAGISQADGSEAAIQQLLAGVDPRRLNTSTIEFGAGRPDALINREAGRFDLGVKQREDAVLVENRARMDAAEPLLRSFYAAAAKNDQKGMDAARAGLVDSGLRSSQFAKAIDEGQGIIAGDLGIENTQLNLEEGRYGLGRRKMSDADSDAAATVMADLQKKGLVTIEDASAYVSSLGLNPRVQNAVMGRISPLEFLGPDSVGGGQGGGSISTAGGSSNANPMSIVNYEARGRGFGAVPDSVQTLGQLDSWATTTLKGTDGTFSSASGPYQITRNTMRSVAEEVLGKNWQSLPNSFENHDKIAAKLFENARGSNAALRNEWAAFKSMSDAEVAAVRAMPWEEARQVIAQKESNTNPNAALSQAGAMGRVQQRDGIFGDPVIDGYMRTVGPGRSIAAVAAGLTSAGGKDSAGGVFAGVDRVTVENSLRDVATRARDIAKKNGMDWSPNADQAALLLENSVGERSWGDWLSDKTGIGASSLGGRSIDDATLEANVLKIAGGQAEKTILAQQRAVQVEQRTAAGQAAYQTQAAFVNRLENTPGVNPKILARERAELAMLAKGVDGEVLQQVVDGDVVSRTGRQTAPQPVAKIPAPASNNRPIEAGPRGGWADQAGYQNRGIGDRPRARSAAPIITRGKDGKLLGIGDRQGVKRGWLER